MDYLSIRGVGEGGGGGGGGGEGVTKTLLVTSYLRLTNTL